VNAKWPEDVVIDWDLIDHEIEGIPWDEELSSRINLDDAEWIVSEVIPTERP